MSEECLRISLEVLVIFLLHKMQKIAKKYFEKIST